MNYLLDAGADPSLVCDKRKDLADLEMTPLHYIFKTNNVGLIIRCLTSPKTPNLNAVNSEGKTPLAYCSHEVLVTLNLQEGVAIVVNKLISFDNTALLTGSRLSERMERAEGSRVQTAIWVP